MSCSCGVPAVPARVRAAIEYLERCDRAVDRCDPSLPERTLTPLESSVAAAALRLLASYFNGEMDFGDMPPKRDDGGDDDDAPEVPAPTPVPTG